MFPSTQNKYKPTSGSKLRKSVTWDDLPPAISRDQPKTPTEPSASPASQKTPKRKSPGSRKYLHAGWSLLRAHQIRKHVLALESRHENTANSNDDNNGNKDDSEVEEERRGSEDASMSSTPESFYRYEGSGGSFASGGLRIAYSNLSDGAQESSEASNRWKGKGKERAVDEGEGEEQNVRTEGMRVEYPSLPPFGK